MIDWNLAPEGADSLKMNSKNVVRFFKGNLRYVDGAFISGFNNNCEWKTIATRPTQTKTVADAVEWFMNGGWGTEWPYYDMDCITYGDSYFAFANSESISPNRYLVCTRFQFEGFGDTEGKQIKEDNMVGRSNITMEDINKHLDTGEDSKGHVNANNVEKILKSSYEQESEKWTHTHSGVECRIKINPPDCDGCLVVIKKAGRYLFCKPENLKPIKPTISAKEHDMLAKYAASLNVDPAEFEQYMRDNYESQLKS